MSSGLRRRPDSNWCLIAERVVPVRNSALDEAPRTPLATGTNYPSRAELAAECALLAYDVLVVYAKAGIALEPIWPYEVNEAPARKPRVDVLDSHAEDCYTRARALEFPPPLKQADQR